MFNYIICIYFKIFLNSINTHFSSMNFIYI